MATISGYQVTAIHNGDAYHIKVAEGVRGVNIPVAASFDGEKWHISLQGSTLTVLEVTKLVPEQK